MANDSLCSYIAHLPVGLPEMGALAGIGPGEFIGHTDLDNLPEAVVAGSNLLEFQGDSPSDLRASVTLSLLAAQRVAANDPVVRTPDQWIERHNTVLKNLNWNIESGGSVETKVDLSKVSVHEAIIPVLTAAFGGGAATSLIIAALNKLKEINKNEPWITLFEQDSRRFGVSEFQFTSINASADAVRLNMAAARFDASYGRTQILFFKIKQQNARFRIAKSQMRTSVSLLDQISDALKTKLADQAKIRVMELAIGD